MNNKIIKLYERRRKAHDELLKIDIEVDDMLSEQMEEKEKLIEKIKNLPTGSFDSTPYKEDLIKELKE